MFELANWPHWLQMARLLGALAITVVLGIHAYDCHVRESAKAVSRRKWMYWLYAMVFLVASLGNFTQLYMAVEVPSYEAAAFHPGYSTLLLALSYVALHAGAYRKPHHL